MTFRKVLALRGPNIWAGSPVLEAWVERDATDAGADGRSVGRLREWLPSLFEPREGGGAPLDDGATPEEVLTAAALELQRLAGVEARFGRSQATAERGVYRVVVEYQEEELGRACLDAALAMIVAARAGQPFDADDAVDRLRRLASSVRLGPSTAALVEAARRRGIPYYRLSAGSLIQLGHGARQRRIYASMTDRIGAVAEGVSTDKELTKGLLREAGVPVPEGRPVESAEDAWEAARALGTPVVVKPRDGDFGDGVTVNLSTREQVLAAYESAARVSGEVLVEQFLAGSCHRLLVVGDRVVAAARRDPAQVVGDGRSTVAQLVEAVNLDPRRGDDHRSPLRTIRLDRSAAATLGEQGYTPDSVPPAGAKVLIRRKTHLTTGGTDADVTDRLHPDIAAHAVAAVKVVGLEVAGIDVMAVDISRPLEEQGGGVLEVNAGPGLRMHLEPVEGRPRPVHEAILETVCPPGDDGRIPLAAVTGVNGKTTTTRLIAHLLRQTGLTVGMTCTDGIYVGDRRIEAGDCSGPKSARAVLMNPRVEAAVLEVARGGLLREGLGFDRCTVAVVTNIGEGDHLGIGGVESIDDLARVKRTVVDAVLPTGAAVLKADDPHVAAMAGRCAGSVVYFARDGGDPVIAGHRAEGGRAVFERGGAVVLADGPVEEELVPLESVSLTRGGTVGFQVENVLAAAAAAWALGLDRGAVRRGLETFDSDVDRVPGRFNIIDLEPAGATLIADFGHNPSALEALAAALDGFPHRRRSVVFSADGDRRDDSILRQSQLVGDAFDRVFLYEEPKRRRGRADGEIAALVRRGLALGSRTTEVVTADGEIAAIGAALDAVRPGELLVVLHDAVDASLAYIRDRLARAGTTGLGV